MTVMINVDGGERTATELGEQAAQAVRALTHLTRPGVGGLADPADAAELSAALARVVGGLPQLLGQLAGWLAGEDRAGRLRLEAGGSPAAGAQQAVTQATTALAQGSRCADAAGHALDTAHQILARLAAAPTRSAGEPDGRP